MKMLSRIEGALLGLACGDALGAPAEFHDQEFVRRNWGTLTEMVGGGMWAPGEWTDDTGMALCVARSLVHNVEDPVPEAGRQFLVWSKTAKDVGSTIRAAISGYQGDWVQASRDTPQARSGMAGGNGSLMRTLPVALGVPGGEDMVRQAARLSAMTHWDGQAEMGCIVYCLLVDKVLSGWVMCEAWTAALAEAREYARRGTWLPDAPGGASTFENQFWQRLENVESLAYRELQPTGYAGYVVDCLEAAVWCCLNASSYEEAVVKAVNLAGEADTIGAVAGGLAGAFWGVEAIPERWLEKLHQRAQVQKVGDELAALRSHLETYANPILPRFEFAKIHDRLFAGRNPLTATDLNQLRAQGVTHVLDLRETREWTEPNLGLEAVASAQALGLTVLNVPIGDLGAPSPAQFDICFQFLQEALANADNAVYVHCRAGRERTAAILAAFVARQQHLGFEQAMEQLRAARPVLAPLQGQSQAVRQWLS